MDIKTDKQLWDEAVNIIHTPTCDLPKYELSNLYRYKDKGYYSENPPEINYKIDKTWCVESEEELDISGSNREELNTSFNTWLSRNVFNVIKDDWDVTNIDISQDIRDYGSTEITISYKELPNEEDLKLFQELFDEHKTKVKIFPLILSEYNKLKVIHCRNHNTEIQKQIKKLKRVTIMINQNINLTFDKAYNLVHYYSTPYKKGKLKGKTPLETCENGFTSYVNSVKVLEQYERMGKFTTPSKHALAKDLLNKIKEEE